MSNHYLRKPKLKRGDRVRTLKGDGYLYGTVDIAVLHTPRHNIKPYWIWAIEWDDGGRTKLIDGNVENGNIEGPITANSPNKRDK